MNLKLFLLMNFVNFIEGTPFSNYSKRKYFSDEEDKFRIKQIALKSPDGIVHVENLTESTNGRLSIPVTAKDMTYHFHSSAGRGGVAVKGDSKNLDSLKRYFNPKKEIVMLIHGWMSNYESPLNVKIKSALLDKYDINVIVVDWEPVASLPYSTLAEEGIIKVAKIIVEFIKLLGSEHKVPTTNISIVGHSLGAHIAGSVGSHLLGKIDHIVGLDPAAPLFSVKEKDLILDSSDAQFVQVIHTEGNLLGFQSSLGHSDYYPNNGRNQPGCGIFDVTCDHSRAYVYYAESIYHKFRAQNCASYKEYTSGSCKGKFSRMGGYKVDKRASGDYYLTTSSAYPFSNNRKC